MSNAGATKSACCAAGRGNARQLFTNYKYEKILVLIFVCTLPLVNPWVRGDGVGYYAFARAPLIEHHLDFRQDWLHANSSFRMGRVDDQNQHTCQRVHLYRPSRQSFLDWPRDSVVPFLAGGSRFRQNQSPLRRTHSRGRIFVPIRFRHGHRHRLLRFSGNLALL